MSEDEPKVPSFDDDADPPDDVPVPPAEPVEESPEREHERARAYSRVPARELIRTPFQAELEELEPLRVLPVYVWDLVVRMTHWTIVLTIGILAVTGYYIGHPVISVPGEARYHFVMGTMKAVHLYAAVAFGLAVLSRILWMFIGPYPARWHRFIPVQKLRREKLWGTLKFYLFAQHRPPAVLGHNPLAGLTYCMVFLLEFVMVGTGLAMYSATNPEAWISLQWLIPLFGGLVTARWIHHVVMWLLLGFAVHHVYSAFLVTAQEKHATMESMISGWKFLHRHDLENAGVPLDKLVLLKRQKGRGDRAA